MSTIADYSVFTKAFLASNNVDFSKPYGKLGQDGSWGDVGDLKAFAVVPLALDHTLTPREALNFDWSKLGTNQDMRDRISCQDADGHFIGNIVRVQPGVREGSIRLVAKVAVPAANEGDVADIKVNTFVLLRTDASTTEDLPIAVATISEGYRLHKHLAIENDPLDDVENANYVSFTINHLNGYTSVDFNPDAYATYDDVANALSRGIDGLHIAFDTASGDLKLLDKDGNVLDQANLPIKTDVIIADGEEGYKYVKTDVKQDIHAAKAWMPEGFTAWDAEKAVPYTMKHAALVVGKGSSRVFLTEKGEGPYTIRTEPVEISHFEINGSIYMLGELDPEGSNGSLFRVKGDAGRPQYNVTLSGGSVTITDASPTDPTSYETTSGNVTVDVVTIEGIRYVLGETANSGNSRYRALSTEGKGGRVYGRIEPSNDSSTGGVVGITIKGDGDVKTMYTFDEGAQPHAEITSISGENVRWLDIKPLTEGASLKYGLEAFVWTVKDREVELNEPFFRQLNASLLALGFHEGDDIALGTNLSILAPTDSVSPLNGVDADEYIHGKDNKATREREVDAQRANAKEELVAWNAQHPALKENRQDGTIIDSSGLDVRKGRIILGCGRKGEDGVFKKINYGIQMKDRSSDSNIQGRSESLDFTISHIDGTFTFDGNGHAQDLTSSTLLSIESGSYISGAPTCLILARVTCNTESSNPVFTPVRTTAGFSVEQSYDTSSGLQLTIHDYRDNIIRLLDPKLSITSVPAIIEVQALYTHRNAQSETVPAQQMHTYIGSWMYVSASDGVRKDHPECSFLCSKIEEWMTAVGLADAQNQDSELYVVIRVY